MSNLPADTQAALESLIRQWTALTQEAKQRADTDDPQALPPVYWSGVQFGLEKAVQDLQELLDRQQK